MIASRERESGTPCRPARNRRVLGPGWLAPALCLLALAVMPDAALACGVCYGEPDAPLTDGMNKGILVLLGFVGVVQAGFVALFWNFRKRARDSQVRRESFELIRGGKTMTGAEVRR